MASFLELLQLPYTGSGPLALSLALNKPLAKRLFIAEGIPTPACVEVMRLPPSTRPECYPAILKLASEDASLGITPANVVADEAAFLARAASLFHTYGGPVMAETFIDGREFTVPLLDGEPAGSRGDRVRRRAAHRQLRLEMGAGHAGVRRDAATVFSGGRRRGTPADARPGTTRVPPSGAARLRACGFPARRRESALRARGQSEPGHHTWFGYCQALEAASVPYAEFLERLLLRALERGAPHTGRAARGRRRCWTSGQDIFYGHTSEQMKQIFDGRRRCPPRGAGQNDTALAKRSTFFGRDSRRSFASELTLVSDGPSGTAVVRRPVTGAEAMSTVLIIGAGGAGAVVGAQVRHEPGRLHPDSPGVADARQVRSHPARLSDARSRFHRSTPTTCRSDGVADRTRAAARSC